MTSCLVMLKWLLSWQEDMQPINGIAYTCSKHEQDHEFYCTVNVHSRQYPVRILDMCFRLVHEDGSVKLYTV